MPTKELYVCNIYWEATEEEIIAAFAPHGKVYGVSMIKYKDTGKFRGYAFVEMNEEACEKATEAMNGIEFKGRKLKVNSAHGKRRR